MADPTAATARLQVISSTCHLVRLLSAPVPHSDSACFDHLDRSAHVCSLTVDAPRALLEAAKVNAGFTYTRAYNTKPSW